MQCSDILMLGFAKARPSHYFHFFFFKGFPVCTKLGNIFSVIQRNSVYIIVIGIGYLNSISINFSKYTMLKTQIFHIHLKFIKIWVKHV